MQNGVNAPVPVSFSTYIALVRSDLYRLDGQSGLRAFLTTYARGSGFRYIFWMRTARFAAGRPRTKWTIFPISKIMLRHYCFKFGIEIPWRTQVGPGLYIGHFGGIVVSPLATLGANCNLSQGVTIGQANRGKRAGAAQVGDSVYFGPGSKVVGRVVIGSHSAIGANAAVTRDVPVGSVVAGVPAQVISASGSDGYIQHPVS